MTLRLDLSIDLDANTLGGVVTITITATVNLLAFNLDFAGPEISAILVNDVPASFTREDLELIIEPATVIADRSEFTVRITYGGTPEPLFLPDFPFPVGWTRFGDSVLVHGPGLAWYPKNETPLDKATFNIRLTVPKPLTATANGELTATIDNGDTSTYDWELKVPIGGVAFAVSDSVLDSRDGPADLVINNYFPSDFAQSSRQSFDIVPEIIELFTDQLGPFPFDTFGITFLRGPLPFHGFGPPQRVFLLSPRDDLIVHEIAHQWFGGSVSAATPADNWLSEGFATYAELLWLEHNWGAEAVIERASSIRRELGSNTRPPAVVNSPADILDQAAYVRGGLTFHALRRELGDDDFFEVLQTYVRRFQYAPPQSPTSYLSLKKSASKTSVTSSTPGFTPNRFLHWSLRDRGHAAKTSQGQHDRGNRG